MSGTPLNLYLERISVQLACLLDQEGECYECSLYTIHKCINSTWTDIKHYCDRWVASRSHFILARTEQRVIDDFRRLAHEWETTPFPLDSRRLVITSLCVMIATLMGCTREEYPLFSELYADNVIVPCSRLIPPRGVLDLMIALSPNVVFTNHHHLIAE